MAKFKFIGFLFWFLALAMLAWFGQVRLPAFINVPAALFVLLGIAGAALISKNPQQTVAGRYKLMGQAAWHSGLISFAIGLIAMLSALDDPKTIGPNIAVALTGILYGTCLSLVFLTLGKAQPKATKE
ncbi:MAG: chemotaxis protein MotA [Clostridiales bacterium]|jgi:flagellar motor component MotA|nr:chemotaxis protein MotA [Clostridiales bacterium]MDN5283439.1 chemotaxis protein MotA [Candidatus Ozemobacter sp.]